MRFRPTATRGTEGRTMRPGPRFPGARRGNHQGARTHGHPGHGVADKKTPAHGSPGRGDPAIREPGPTRFLPAASQGTSGIAGGMREGRAMRIHSGAVARSCVLKRPAHLAVRAVRDGTCPTLPGALGTLCLKPAVPPVSPWAHQAFSLRGDVKQWFSTVHYGKVK